jgi:hypothetical protein
MSPIPDPRSDGLGCQMLLKPTVQKALALLLEGYDFACDLEVCVWEFAVPIRTLLTAGCSVNTLRWLVRRCFAEFAVLTGKTAKNKPRHIAETIEFAEKTSFVLTEAGAAAAHAACPPLTLKPRADEPRVGPYRVDPAIPAWDQQLGELRYLGTLVKRLRKASSNQWAILRAFQREGWPQELENPLRQSARDGVNPKQRLHDAIKNLNRDHEALLLRFYGAGSGCGVGWRPLV